MSGAVVVRSPADVPSTRPGLRSRAAWPLLVILAVVVAANLLPLLRFVQTDPVLTRSGLGLVTKAPLVGGNYTLDPNDGYTALALEHRAALDWVHGRLPLWVPQEGTGAPLLAEGQSAVFSPLSLLTLLPQGLLLQHMLCELIAGLATYGLGRMLGFRRGVATTLGVVFALNGTFAWLANAVVNPICWLPVMLLGLERIRAGRRHGGALLAAGVALTLVAGFPEVGVLDLLLAGLWTVVRLPGARSKRGMVLRATAGAGVGGLLAAPAIVPFLRYLSIAYVGTHPRDLAFTHLPAAGFSVLGLPYVRGNAAESGGVNPTELFTWSSVGGYLTATVLVLAVVGLGARRAPRALRIGLAGWIAFCLLRSFGFHPVEQLLSVVPELNRSLFYRYSPPSYELAATVLAGHGLTELAETKGTRRAWVARGLAAVAMLSMTGVYLAVRPAADRLPAWVTPWTVASLAIAAVAVVAVGAATLRPRWLPVGLVLTLTCADAVVAFVLPQLAAPRSITLDRPVLTYLQQHAEGQRVYSINGVFPNFGAYFGFRLLDVNDLPVPALWPKEVNARFDPNYDRNNFPEPLRDPSLPTFPQLLDTLESQYEDGGVALVIERTDAAAFPPDATIVYRDPSFTIGRLPASRPLISAESGGPCTTSGQEYATFHTDCSAPAEIRVTQLALPGWSAKVDGHDVPVRNDASGFYQLVDVPVGGSTVVMRYWAPGLTAGLVLALVGAVVGLLLWNSCQLGRLRRRLVHGPLGSRARSLPPTPER